MFQIHLHRPDDLDEFYKIIPKECLPEEYGGSLQSVQIYKSEYKLHQSFPLY